MDKIFITHSRHDAPILAHFDLLVNEAGVAPVFYQYDVNQTAPPWQEIRDEIRTSSALFVVLSNNLGSTAHTQNWIGLEVGIACDAGRRV